MKIEHLDLDFEHQNELRVINNTRKFYCRVFLSGQISNVGNKNNSLTSRE